MGKEEKAVEPDAEFACKARIKGENLDMLMDSLTDSQKEWFEGYAQASAGSISATIRMPTICVHSSLAWCFQFCAWGRCVCLILRKYLLLLGFYAIVVRWIRMIVMVLFMSVGDGPILSHKIAILSLNEIFSGKSPYDFFANRLCKKRRYRPVRAEAAREIHPRRCR